MRFPLSSVPKDFGSALRAERLDRGWSQARLAGAAGLKRETVARLEAGARRPAADTVFRLQFALDLDPGRLVPAWPEWSPIGLTTVAARTRERRREMGLSLRTVAGQAGMSASTLSRFERETSWEFRSRLATRRDGSVTPEADALARSLGFDDSAAHIMWCSPD